MMAIDPTVDLVRYEWKDGQWTFKDSEIRCFYDHMVGKRETWYNADDKDFRDNPRWNVVSYFRSCMVWLVTVDGQPGGLIWLSSVNRPNKSGFLNFAVMDFLTETMQRKVHVCLEAVRRVMDMPEFNVLYAETSVCRTTSLMMADYIGFQRLGVIPKAHYHIDEDRYYDTVFMYLTKETIRRN